MPPEQQQPQQPPIDQPDLQPESSRPVNRALLVPGSLIVFVVLIAVSTYLAFGGSSTGPKSSSATASVFQATTIQPAAVSITSSGFVPATISIKAGQAVVWTNSDTTPHTVSSDDPKPLVKSTPDPNSLESISPRDTYTYTFNKSGTYTYHDNLSPDFSGTVVVK